VIFLFPPPSVPDLPANAPVSWPFSTYIEDVFNSAFFSGLQFCAPTFLTHSERLLLSSPVNFFASPQPPNVFFGPLSYLSAKYREMLSICLLPLFSPPRCPSSVASPPFLLRSKLKDSGGRDYRSFSPFTISSP